jgi:predicted DNA-binding protein with PD1-like motif
MKVVPLRLQPGDDLRLALEAWMGERQEQAGCLISAVGSLSVAHLHITIANSKGAVIGGHLCAGSLVRTTAELRISPQDLS